MNYRGEHLSLPRPAVGWVIAVALVAATLMVFWPVGDHEFISLDDPLYVTANPQVLPGLTWQGLRWSLTSFTGGNWHPLTWLSHMADMELFGLSPGRHHLVNVAFHGANSALLFLALLLMTRAMWPSALCGALFALHPLHVESVAWVAERKDVLSTFLAFITLLLYWRYTRKPGPGWYAAILVAFALGLAAKPMLVTLPALLLLLDWWPLGRFRSCRVPGGVSAGRLVAEKLPLVMLSAASAYVAIAAQGARGSIQPLTALPLAVRVSNALLAYVGYLRRAVWPSGLALQYPYPLGGTRWLGALGAAAALAAVSIMILRMERRRYLAVGWLWFLGTLVPVIGLVQVGAQSMADRYTYLPLAGLCIMAAWGLQDVVQARPRLVKPAVALVLSWLMVLGAVSRNQVNYWRDSITVYNRSLAVTKDNWLIEHNLGVVLYDLGKKPEAAEHLRRAIGLNPYFAKSPLLLGVILEGEGRLREAEGHLQTAVRLDETIPEARFALGNTLVKLDRLPDALIQFRAAVALKPAWPEVHNNIGMVLLESGLPGAAEDAFREALRHDPGQKMARRNLERLLKQSESRRPSH